MLDNHISFIISFLFWNHPLVSRAYSMKSDLLMLPLWARSSTSWRLSSTWKCCNIYHSHSHTVTGEPPSNLIKSVYFCHSRHTDPPCVVHVWLLSSHQFRLNYKAAQLFITWNISPSFCVHLVFRLLRMALKAMLCWEDSVCDHTVTTEAGDVLVQLNI